MLAVCLYRISCSTPLSTKQPGGDVECVCLWHFDPQIVNFLSTSPSHLSSSSPLLLLFPLPSSVRAEGAAPPCDSIVLCYEGRSVAILRPADLDQLREQTKCIFGLPQDDTSPDGKTRTLIRFIYYVGPFAQTAQSPSAERCKVGGSRATTDAIDDEEDEREDESRAGNSKRKRIESVQPPTGPKERELGPGLLASLRDDFELTVKLLTLPVRNIAVRSPPFNGNRANGHGQAPIQPSVAEKALSGRNSAGPQSVRSKGSKPRWQTAPAEPTNRKADQSGKTRHQVQQVEDPPSEAARCLKVPIEPPRLTKQQARPPVDALEKSIAQRDGP